MPGASRASADSASTVLAVPAELLQAPIAAAVSAGPAKTTDLRHVHPGPEMSEASVAAARAAEPTVAADESTVAATTTWAASNDSDLVRTPSLRARPDLGEVSVVSEALCPTVSASRSLPASSGQPLVRSTSAETLPTVRTGVARADVSQAVYVARAGSSSSASSTHVLVRSKSADIFPTARSGVARAGESQVAVVPVTDRTPDRFVQLQAILASLPMHAVPPAGFWGWASCGGARPRQAEELKTDLASCKARIEAALRQASEDYPGFRDDLGRLEVAFSCIDYSCLADHTKERIFTVTRGTDRRVNPLTFPRDWFENALLVCGGPRRHGHAMKDYRAVRKKYANYDSFGSGHSLGGVVIWYLANSVASDESLRFKRVDVFNTPVARPTTCGKVEPLLSAKVQFHRINGDWATEFSWVKALPTDQLHTYPSKASIPDKHALRHFLPDKACADTEVPPEQACADTEVPPEQKKCAVLERPPQQARAIQDGCSFDRSISNQTSERRSLFSVLLDTIGRDFCAGKRVKDPKDIGEGVPSGSASGVATAALGVAVIEGNRVSSTLMPQATAPALHDVSCSGGMAAASHASHAVSAAHGACAV
eukprot:TRINITY_DN8683_c0_g1_i1.p1 TRINITY_DN8683_c0_g1~~TRINITY_DN8683_c0_g1_i1.p1  ORF type:complete len:598 (-),score=70.33 TRINITY_DN8683_c0_g1_i1:134-1927(-)